MRFEVKRQIDLPAGQVFAFFADAANNPKWQQGMVSCRWISDGPIDVGSRYEQIARFAGRDIRSVFEVVRYVPGESISIETIESTFPIQVTRSVKEIDEDTSEVSAVITGGPERGPMKWLEPLMNGKARRSIEADYDRLVQLLGANDT